MTIDLSAIYDDDDSQTSVELCDFLYEWLQQRPDTAFVAVWYLGRGVFQHPSFQPDDGEKVLQLWAEARKPNVVSDSTE